MHWIDPESLPEISGVVDCVLLNADGEADGLVLRDGTEVHFPPHMADAILETVRPGTAVRVRGVRPRGVRMVAAVSVAPEGGAAITDGGPPEDDASRKAQRKAADALRAPMDVRGTVRQVLHGPRGEVRGVLLADGSAGRFPPHAAGAVADMLVPGEAIVLRGGGLATPHGTVVQVHGLGTSAADLRMLERKKPHGAKAHGAKAHGAKKGGAEHGRDALSA